MTDSQAEESRAELIAYRLARSEEALEDARILAQAERWDACMSRLYYVCFYAVSALLLNHDLSSSKHTGIRSLFNRHLVKSGQVPKDLAQIYNDLFERRQKSDYLDFHHFEEDQVRPWIPRVERFLGQINLRIDAFHDTAG